MNEKQVYDYPAARLIEDHPMLQNRRIPQYTRSAPKYGRNERCMCGSGKKFKACCLGKTEEEIAEKVFKHAETSTKQHENYEPPTIL